MYKLNWSRWWGIYFLTFVFIPSTGFAIPSPDVIVNVFASAGQVLGLLSVAFGAAAVRSRGQGKKGKSKVGRGILYVLGTLLIGSVVCNLLQYTWQMDQVTRRLSANLTRSSTEEGKKVGDINLKTLSFSDQLKHPGGFSTEVFQKDLEKADFSDRYQFIDVRNPEEIEMGRMPKALAVPQPDLKAQRQSFYSNSKPFILFCDSGNRSGELCDLFISEGKSCHFVIGGFEKWNSEYRPVLDAQVGDSGDFRDVVSYPNKNTLLDTPEVERLISEEKAVFIDVRYPGDFDLGHLPGAINIPLRKLQTEEMWEALKAVPKQPVIAPCYDKRSCFYGLILGLRMHRLGYDYRGRYTVPYEYTIPTKEKEYIAKWRAENEKTFFGLLRMPLIGLLASLQRHSSDLIIALLAFVTLLRLLFLPFGVKAERDQIFSDQHKPELDALKKKTGSDPTRYSRAIAAWHKKHRISPGLNLLGSLLQLGIFLLAFGAVQKVAEGIHERFLWVASPLDSDPLYLLPTFVCVLLLFFLVLTAKKHTVKSWALKGSFLVLLAALTLKLPASLNVYLVFNLSFMLLQTIILRRLLVQKPQSQTHTDDSDYNPAEGIFPLRMAHKVAGAGAKANRLGQMLEAGLPVPNGFVITEHLFARNDLEQETDELKLSQADAKRLVRLRSSMKSRCVAVRSSGLNEDGAEQSYAGVFESIVNVKPYEFGAAVQDVRASLRSQRVKAYSGNDAERGGILVQEMIDAEYAGVMFTEHPTESGTVLIELTEGLGDALVSGATNAEPFCFGRTTGTNLGDETSPINLVPLIKFGKDIEHLFKSPQDVEWAYANGKFSILQARNITRLLRLSSSLTNTKSILESERYRLLSLVKDTKDPDQEIFFQNELSELLPNPMPLSLSLMQALWEPGGSTDLACREVGIPYSVSEYEIPMVTTVFGALYINRVEQEKRTSISPGFLDSFRLSRRSQSLEDDFKNVFLPDFLPEIRLRAAVHFESLNTRQLLVLWEEWVDHFIHETYVEAEKINVAADFYFKAAQQSLERRGLNAAEHLSHVPPNITFQAMSLLPLINSGEKSVNEFLDVYGHRAPHDYELSQPRYREAPQQVREFLRVSNHAHVQRESDSEKISPLIERACKYQALKEDAKHYALLELAELRRLIVSIGKRFELGEDIFYLTIDEVKLLETESGIAELRSRIEKRKAERLVFSKIRLPATLTLKQLESLSIDTQGTVRAQALQKAASNGHLAGTLVAGSSSVQGKVRIIVEENDMIFFRPGEILITRFTNPKWTPLFSQASGVVTEVGGWLSHAAILAREYNLTTIVGVSSALERLQTGEEIRLCMDGTIERLSESK